MKKRDESLKLIDYLQGKYIIKYYDIDYDNTEIEVLGDVNNEIIINNKDITIDFQKQNSSFILVYKKSINHNFIASLINDVNNALNMQEFAKYKFNNYEDHIIIHWVYNEEKLNRDLLQKLENDKQIIDLEFII